VTGWRLVAYLVAVAACGWVAAERGRHAWQEFDDAARPDGNSGHAQIDFGGQWVAARLFADDGRNLYRRASQRAVVQAHFPVGDDADALMGWFVGDDPPAGDGVGGPLYPPVHGLLYAPLARLEPQTAYRVFQLGSLGLAVFAGFAIARATGGRLWWPLATLAVLTFPGCRGGLDLGQNHLLTLALLAGGWWAMAANKPIQGGVIWGLLAFKPVWAVAFLPALVLLGRWRSAAAMCGTAGLLILATLPVVGVQAWLDWLTVGGRASARYAVSENWIGYSRDLGGLPRRMLVDFAKPEADRANPTATLAGWGLLAAVWAGTAAVAWLRPTRVGVVLLGAYLGCYRFMYYDVTLAVLPVAVLIAAGSRAAVAVAGLLILYENWLMHFGLEVRISTGAVGGRAADDQPGTRVFSAVGSYRYAWDTAALLALWGWAAVSPGPHLDRQPAGE
jgi:hypothetical protein